MVTLTRLDDKTSVTFRPTTNRSSDGVLRGSVIDSQGFGVANAIIFQPESRMAPQPGDSFKVVVSGLTTKQGRPATLQYTTHVR